MHEKKERKLHAMYGKKTFLMGENSLFLLEKTKV